MDSINNVCKFGSDAWLELQAFKTRQLNRREKLNRHKNLHMELANAHGQNHLAKSQVPPLLNNPSSSRTNQPSSPSICSRLSDEQRPNDDISSRKNRDLLLTSSSFQSPSGKSNSLQPPTILDHSSAIDTISCDHENPELVECLLLLKLCDVALKLPIDSKSLQRFINKVRGLEKITQSFVENLLQKFAHQRLITIEEPTSSSINGRKKLTNPGCVLDSRVDDDEYCIYVTSADHTRLVEFDKSFGSIDNMRALLIESKTYDSTQHNNTGEFEFSGSKTQSSVPVQVVRSSDTRLRLFDRDDCTSESIPRAGLSIDDTTRSKKIRTPNSKTITITDIRRQREHGEDLESLLSLASTRELESKKLGEELLELLSKPTFPRG